MKPYELFVIVMILSVIYILFNLPSAKSTNRWYVDPALSSGNGTILRPFNSIAKALEHIEALIARGSLSITANDGLVDNPQFIILRSATYEDVVLTRGNVFLCGESPNAGHIPIWIHGTVTVTPNESFDIDGNRFGLYHISILPPLGTSHCIEFNGSNPAKLYLEDVYAYQADSSKSCVLSNNTGTGSRIDMIDCTMSRANGFQCLIDIQRGLCNISNLETNGIGQVLNFANDSRGTVIRSVLDSDGGAVITLGDTVQFGMGEVILNNTGIADSYGVYMTDDATMQFGVCTFNIANYTSNRAILGEDDQDVLYANVIFQAGSTNTSEMVTLTPLNTTFTTV
jgi:hypothetical protein